MAARSPRRIFGSPFVITLATIPACATTTTPPPPAIAQPEPGRAEPAPTAEPTAGPDAPDAPPVVANPPRPVAPPPDAPAPAPATYDQRWAVMKAQSGCIAIADVECPKAVPGKPTPTCNLPPPIKYACPDGFADGETLKIVLRAGQTECMVDFGPMKCPPNTRCNPPRPRPVACPKP